MWRDFTEQLEEIEKPLVDFYVRVLREKIVGHQVPEILEVGSGWGLFARSAMEAFLTSKLTTIEKCDPANPSFYHHTKGFEDRIRSLVGKPSAEVLPKLRKGAFHFAFIDADHSFKAAFSDANLAWENLQEGGWLMFDDVFHKNNWKFEKGAEDFDYGTARAVWKFMNEKGIREAEYHAYGKGGLILIQKPKV